MKLLYTGALLSALLITAPAANAARREPLIEPDRVVLKSMDGQPLTVQQVRNAILAGAQPLGWTVTADSPGVLQLSYNKQNKHFVTIRATYDDQGYQLRYVTSTNLNYDIKDTGAEIHPNYNRWIQNLIAHIMVPGTVIAAQPAAQAASR